jgi:ATP-dependent DNA helicase RecG
MLGRKQLIKRKSLNDQSLLLELRKKKQPSLKLDCRSPVIRAKRCRGVIHLNDAEIILPSEIGMQPVYKGKGGKVSQAQVAKEIASRLDASIPLATTLLINKLSDKLATEASIETIIGIHPSKLSTVLRQAHFPDTPKHWTAAMNILQRIAIFTASEALLTFRQPQQATPFSSVGYTQLTQNVPFELTAEQKSVVGEMVKHIQQGKKLEGVLIGDVGTGKTITYGVLAAYFAWAKKRVAILLPNESLARQIQSELSDFFPFMQPQLVLGSESNTPLDHTVYIGTTALLFREVGDFDLIICDEQQKLSTQQREKLKGSETHCLDVTATPIPRTMALASYGVTDSYVLTQCHVKKNIKTQIVEAEGRRQMFLDVMATVERAKRCWWCVLNAWLILQIKMAYRP